MTILFKLVILLIWFPQAIAQVIVWSYWLQVKEYRFDRFKGLLKSTLGKQRLNLNYSIFKIIALGLSPTPLIPLALFIAADSNYLSNIIRKRFPRPVITERIKKLFFITVVGEITIFALTFFGVYRFELAIFMAELFLILGPTIGIWWTKSLVNKLKYEEIKKAEIKLAAINPLVIGITGSYGKTTTKEFIAHLLSKKYLTEKTSKNENNEFGVARKVLNDFDSTTKVFVAEMGAYTVGEIASIASFTHPSIGVITGIEPQHLELFGSFDNIKRAKFELIEALPKNGTAIFNVTNADVEDLAQQAEKLTSNLKVLRYKLVTEFESGRKLSAQSKIISSTVSKIRFEIKIGKTTKQMEVPFSGKHFIENLTGAILIARNLKVDWKTISGLCKSLTTRSGTLDMYKLRSQVTIIDDSYNATPIGFSSALKFLDQFSKTKVVITSGVIELGTHSHIVHKNLGTEMAVSTDKIILTNPDFVNDIAKGLGDNKNKLLVCTDPKELVEHFKEFNNSKTVILLEGRLPSELTKFMDSQKT